MAIRPSCSSGKLNGELGVKQVAPVDRLLQGLQVPPGVVVVIAPPHALVPQVGVTERAPEHSNFLVAGELAEQTVHLFLQPDGILQTLRLVEAVEDDPEGDVAMANGAHGRHRVRRGVGSASHEDLDDQVHVPRTQRPMNQVDESTDEGGSQGLLRTVETFLVGLVVLPPLFGEVSAADECVGHERQRAVAHEPPEGDSVSIPP